MAIDIRFWLAIGSDFSYRGIIFYFSYLELIFSGYSSMD